MGQGNARQRKEPAEFMVAPDPTDPRLTERVDGTDQDGGAITTSVTVERPLTLFLNGQEIVTMMSICDYPDYLAIGYLVFSANSGPSTTVDVNNTPAVGAPADPALAPAPMTEAPAAPATDVAPMTEAAPATEAPAVQAPATDAAPAVEPTPAAEPAVEPAA